MKILFHLFLFIMLIFSWGSYCWAENWSKWERSENWQERQQDSTESRARRYESVREGSVDASSKGVQRVRSCSFAEEGGLLDLLDELRDLEKNPAQGRGGESVVRQKYRIARKLRQYDDCRAEDALRALIKENACEGQDEGDLFCVAWGATASLQEAKSKKDVKKLTPDTPLADQLKVIKKYGTHPHKNDVASHAVMTFLIKQAGTNPEIYVPLLVEYFPCCPMIMPVVKKYPQKTRAGLQKALLAANPTVVWAGINLARTLHLVEMFPQVYDVAFARKGAIDYAHQGDVKSIQVMALGFFRQDEEAALPYYRQILWGDFPEIKGYIISSIKDVKSHDLLEMLKEFAVHLRQQPGSSKNLILARLQSKIDLMVEAQR